MRHGFSLTVGRGGIIIRDEVIDMDHGFLAAAERHLNKYPLSSAADLCKLAYQAEFGPEHIIHASGGVLRGIERELPSLPLNVETESEYIGGGMCRVPVSFAAREDDARLLAEAVFQSASRRRGTLEGLEGKLASVRGLAPDGFDAFVDAWRKSGFEPLHHSEGYRRAYAPHYRLVCADIAAVLPLLSLIRARETAGRRSLVAVDGRCGCGKTHISAVMAQLLGCSVIHMDDFYLPTERRAANWRELVGGNMDFARLRGEVIDPLLRGGEATCRAYDCRNGAFGEPRKLAPAATYIVEGSYCMHPAMGDIYDFSLFVTAPRELQRERLAAREGDHFEAFEELWIPAEECYFEACGVEGRCGCTLVSFPDGDVRLEIK